MDTFNEPLHGNNNHPKRDIFFGGVIALFLGCIGLAVLTQVAPSTPLVERMGTLVDPDTDVQVTYVAEGFAEPEVDRVWELPYKFSFPFGDSIQQPFIKGEIALFSNLYRPAELVAVNVRTGKPLWSQPIPTLSDPYVYVSDPMVYVVHHGISAIDLRTGTVLWFAQIDFLNGPVLQIGDVLVASSWTRLSGIDMYSGKVLWTFETRSSEGEVLQSGPEFGTVENRLFVLSRATSELLELAPSNGDLIRGQPVEISSDKAQIRGNDSSIVLFDGLGSVSAFDIDTLELLWTHSLNLNVDLTMEDGDVHGSYFEVTDSLITLSAKTWMDSVSLQLDARTGETIWLDDTEHPLSVWASDGSLVYGTNYGGDLVALDPVNSKPVWIIDADASDRGLHLAVSERYLVFTIGDEAWSVSLPALEILSS